MRHHGSGLHERVVHRLGSRIVDGTIPPGSVLPTEEELGAEFGVSRSILREAVKVLAGKGLLEVRPRVGTRVRARPSWHLLDLDVVRWRYAQRREYDLRELTELRAAIEPAAAYLAAQRRDADDLATMTAHLARMDAATADPVAFRSAELDFRTAVVDSAHNTLLSHIGGIVRIASGTAVEEAAEGGGRVELGTDGYQAVRAAICEHDAAGAEQAMRMLLGLRTATVESEQ